MKTLKYIPTGPADDPSRTGTLSDIFRVERKDYGEGRSHYTVSIIEEVFVPLDKTDMAFAQALNRALNVHGLCVDTGQVMNFLGFARLSLKEMKLWIANHNEYIRQMQEQIEQYGILMESYRPIIELKEKNYGKDIDQR